MRRLTRSIVLICLALPPSLTLSQERQSFDNRIEKHRAGPVSIGQQAQSLYRQFDKPNRELIDLEHEGSLSPALALRFPDSIGQGRVIAELIAKESELVVWRIQITDPRFRTSKGIGVGSTVGDLRSKYDLDYIGRGEGNTVIYVSEIRASFVLDSSRNRELKSFRDVVQVPGDVEIESVLLIQ